MIYGLILWGNSTEAQRIFLLQKRVLRTICKMRGRDSCRDIFKELNILTLPAAYILECAVIAKTKPEYFTNNSNIHNHNTRQARDLHVQQARTTLVKRSPYHMCIKIYNSLPQDLKNEEESKILKNKLKSYLVEKKLYSVKEYFEGQL